MAEEQIYIDEFDLTPEPTEVKEDKEKLVEEKTRLAKKEKVFQQ